MISSAGHSILEKILSSSWHSGNFPGFFCGEPAERAALLLLKFHMDLFNWLMMAFSTREVDSGDRSHAMLNSF